ncbi:hypothetical protein IPH92_05030 [Candidatus Kaiserbacteria bacterium]|nr:MAG: hypothetical protein IPH92_05030 [Candidatus Kaiserbacteria bacterium]
MSGESFPRFKESLETQGLLQESKGIQFFDTKVLASAACDFSEKPDPKAHQQKYGTTEKCQGIFIARNGLGGTMTLDDFRTQGQGVGFWLADISAGAGPVVAAAAPKAVATESKDDGKMNSLLAGLTSLIKRFDMLSESEKVTKKKVEEILIQQKQVNAVTARIEALEKQTAGLDHRAGATDGDVKLLKKDVADVNKDVAGINTRVTSIEKMPIVAFGNVVLGIVLIMAFVLCLMAYVVYRKAKAASVSQRPASAQHIPASNESVVRKAA